ncbi:MAG: c-type cytochrome [Sulfuricella sp.]|nr:c-type cytochrome [Sulfuricella sp.]
MKQFIVMTAMLAGVTASCTAAAALPKGDPEKGKQIASQVCMACHGVDGNGTEPTNPEFPKLAGKQAEYLLKQLKDFKAGKRKNEIMAGMVANLTPDDMANLALYYAGQKAKPGVVKNPALLAQGKKIYLDGNPDAGVPACAGCHEADASGYGFFPHLAGQHTEYTFLQLKRFNTGERDNDKGLAMQSVTVKMTEQEMRAVAEYLAGVQLK